MCLYELILFSYEQEDIPKLAEIENALAVFMMATYGEGDPTDNAQELYDQMQSDSWDLKGLKYAVSYGLWLVLNICIKVFYLYNKMFPRFLDLEIKHTNILTRWESILTNDSKN